VHRRVAVALLGILVMLPTAMMGQAARSTVRIPDFEGIWNSATATPLERPRDLKDKPFFTPEEAAAFERQAARSVDEPTNSQNVGTGTYNTFFREFGTTTVKTLRTSIVTEPADGRIPPLTPAAAEVRRLRLERQRGMENPEDFGLQDQCLAFSTVGPPMLPYSYNSNYQIVQTPTAIVIHAEMIHDARVIDMTRREHRPAAVRLWMGDSIGHWDGDTLVVDTTNFTDAGGFYGSAGGNFGWDANLHIVERLRAFDPDTLLYQFAIDDPSAFTQPWKGELTLSRSSGPIFEFACHEANYALTNLLRGARATEQRQR
jgi:hypothetical protein